MKKLLLHSCCAPCSTSVIEELINEYSITVLFYNPNIYPKEEYIKRKEEQKQYLEKKYPNKVGFISLDYDDDRFYSETKGYEHDKEGGKRCEICFRLRLETTAQYAKENNFDIFTTTLTISPLKNQKVINFIGEELSNKYAIEFLSANFKKKDGYLKSIRLSKENNLYRQTYCGCKFSLNSRQ